MSAHLEVLQVSSQAPIALHHVGWTPLGGESTSVHAGHLDSRRADVADFLRKRVSNITFTCPDVTLAHLVTREARRGPWPSPFRPAGRRPRKIPRMCEVQRDTYAKESSIFE